MGKTDQHLIDDLIDGLIDGLINDGHIQVPT